MSSLTNLGNAEVRDKSKAARRRLPLFVSAGLGLVVGAMAGFINGWLVVTFKLPSLVVTLGTLGLFQGLAFILLQNNSISTLPVELTTFAQGSIPGTAIPYSLLLVIAVAVVAGALLHKGSLGRKMFAVGSSIEAARFSGIKVHKVKLLLFAVSGAVAAIAGMLYTGYVSSARADNGTGLELTVVAIVLIGGVSMFGGKGSFVGVVLALILVSSLTSWMNLNFIQSNVQNIAVGVLMIGAVAIPALISIIRNRKRPAAWSVSVGNQSEGLESPPSTEKP